MTVEPRRNFRETQDNLDYREGWLMLCSGVLSLLIYVLVLFFTDLPILLVYGCYLVTVFLLPPFIEFVIDSFELRFQEKRFRLSHWEK